MWGLHFYKPNLLVCAVVSLGGDLDEVQLFEAGPEGLVFFIVSIARNVILKHRNKLFCELFLVTNVEYGAAWKPMDDTICLGIIDHLMQKLNEV